MTQRVSRDIYRVAELGLIHQGRVAERVTGGAALGRKHRGQARAWTHPIAGVLLAVAMLLAYAWSGS